VCVFERKAGAGAGAVKKVKSHLKQYCFSFGAIAVSKKYEVRVGILKLIFIVNCIFSPQTTSP
jgi:hypothetical protein